MKAEGERRNLYSEGMEIDARYVRRKDLNLYLPPSVLGKKKVTYLTVSVIKAM